MIDPVPVTLIVALILSFEASCPMSKLGLLVDTGACRPTECELECLTACQRIHGSNSPLEVSKIGVPPTIDQSRCTSCLSCIRACPFDAIQRLSEQSASSYRKPASHSDPLPIKERPYEVSDDFQRFPESKTIFARAVYDKDYEYCGMDMYSNAGLMVEKGLPEYNEFELNLSIAGWELYDTLKDRHSYIDRARQELQNPHKRSQIDPQKLTEMVKKAAKFYGARLVGVAELDRRWIYTGDRRDQPYDVPDEINRVIVMAIEMDYDAIAASPGYMASAEVSRCYSQMTFAETELCAFIRRFGYSAISCGNDIVISVPVAIDAGLGQYGRNGLLITKEFGPRVRLAKVITDMPLIPDEPDLKFAKSVVRFCEVCEKCAHTCPSQSIAYGKERTWSGKTISNNPGIKKWYINPETCYGFWVENGSDCSNCIRSCPYNKPNSLLHRFIIWVTIHFPWLDRLIVKMDDLAGYGKQKLSGRFWKKIWRGK